MAFSSKAVVLEAAVGAIALAVVLVAGSSQAHNTNTTHHRITALALEKIEADDAGVHAYAQMYRVRLIPVGRM